MHLVGNPPLEFMRHDVTFPLYVEVDQIYNLAFPASHQDECVWSHQYARPQLAKSMETLKCKQKKALWVLPIWATLGNTPCLNLIGWFPVESLDDGLKETIKYFSSILNS